MIMTEPFYEETMRLSLGIGSGVKKVGPNPNIFGFDSSEFSLRYLLIFKDQILVLDFSNRYKKKTLSDALLR